MNLVTKKATATNKKVGTLMTPDEVHNFISPMTPGLVARCSRVHLYEEARGGELVSIM